MHFRFSTLPTRQYGCAIIKRRDRTSIPFERSQDGLFAGAFKRKVGTERRKINDDIVSNADESADGA